VNLPIQGVGRSSGTPGAASLSQNSQARVNKLNCAVASGRARVQDGTLAMQPVKHRHVTCTGAEFISERRSFARVGTWKYIIKVRLKTVGCTLASSR
jgi:hypothetical protein